MTTFVQVREVKVLIVGVFFINRENSEITKKQTKQSMESAKALALDKTIQSKEERDRYLTVCWLHKPSNNANRKILGNKTLMCDHSNGGY